MHCRDIIKVSCGLLIKQRSLNFPRDFFVHGRGVIRLGNLISCLKEEWESPVGAHSSALTPRETLPANEWVPPPLGYTEGALTPCSSLWVLRRSRKDTTQGVPDILQGRINAAKFSQSWKRRWREIEPGFGTRTRKKSRGEMRRRGERQQSCNNEKTKNCTEREQEMWIGVVPTQKLLGHLSCPSAQCPAPSRWHQCHTGPAGREHNQRELQRVSSPRSSPGNHEFWNRQRKKITARKLLKLLKDKIYGRAHFCWLALQSTTAANWISCQNQLRIEPSLSLLLRLSREKVLEDKN